MANGSTVLPSVISKAADWLYNKPASSTTTTATTRNSTETTLGPNRDGETLESARRTSGSVFEYKGSSYTDSDSSYNKQCKAGYDRWTKTDDYTSTTNRYTQLTQKKAACDTTLNKVKNFFGRGQTMSQSETAELNKVTSHLDYMTSCGGIGQ